MFDSILWDFDGVILDSMPIRSDGFIEVLKNFPEDEVNDLLDYHLRNGGLSRYVKFRYFFEEIRGEKVSDGKVQEMANSFSEVMRQMLVNPSLLINDSLDFIREYCESVPMHIVSGSDGNELRFLCEALEISKYFQSINGSPTPKKELVRTLLKEHNYAKDNVVLIGDSLNDYEAAADNDIGFLAYNNQSLSRAHSYISNFGKLKLNDLKKIVS